MPYIFINKKILRHNTLYESRALLLNDAIEKVTKKKYE